MPKYARVWSGLFAVGFGLTAVSRQFDEPVKNIAGSIGLLMLVAGLGVSVAGMVAERKEREKRREASSANR